MSKICTLLVERIINISPIEVTFHVKSHRDYVTLNISGHGYNDIKLNIEDKSYFNELIKHSAYFYYNGKTRQKEIDFNKTLIKSIMSILNVIGTFYGEYYVKSDKKLNGIFKKIIKTENSEFIFSKFKNKDDTLLDFALTIYDFILKESRFDFDKIIINQDIEAIVEYFNKNKDVVFKNNLNFIICRFAEKLKG